MSDNPIPRIPFHRRLRTLVIGGIAVPGILAGLTLPTGSDPVDDIPAGTPVRVQAVDWLPGYERTVSFTGRLEARRQSGLGFERAGRLNRVAVAEGDPVRTGQVLATLDDRTLRADIAKSEAAVRAARARLSELENGARPETIRQSAARQSELEQELELARENQHRAEELYRRGAISRTELDRTRNQAATLASRLQGAEAQLTELRQGPRSEQVEAQRWEVAALEAGLRGLQEELAKASLRAPFDGTIIRRHLDEGVIAGPGVPVLTLAESGELIARIGMTPQFAATLAPGAQVELEVAGRVHGATVNAVLPQVDPGLLTVPVLFEVESGQLRQGEQVTFNGRQRIETPGFKVPLAALGTAPSGLWSLHGVEVQGDRQVSVRHLVELIDQASEFAFVRGTLREGDLIVTDGSHRLVPSQSLTAVPGDDRAAAVLHRLTADSATIARNPGREP